MVYGLTEFLKKRKVRWVFPVVISLKFRMGQYRDGLHREDAPHFTLSCHTTVTIQCRVDSKILTFHGTPLARGMDFVISIGFSKE